MKVVGFVVGAAVTTVLVLCERVADADETAITLPEGVTAVWNQGLAFREATATRERICINGLWRWQPASKPSDIVPAGNWGYFKVPGSWPGITDYMQKDCQTLFAHPSWADLRLASVTAAWYQREISIPESWRGRRITLSVECLNSLASVYVDGKQAGELRFPGGELELSRHCRPGQTHILTMLVTALPLKSVMLVHNDTNTARQVAGSVARRGLCGDVFLIGAPQGARIADVKVSTSVRRGEITFDVALDQLEADAAYAVHAELSDGGRSLHGFDSPAFQSGDLKEGRIVLSDKWKPEKLWDIHTPQNLSQISLTLRASNGRVLDVSFPQRFGFREFWIEGRDFFLNGSRIHLCAVPLDNAQVGAAWASYDGAKESLTRLKSFGVNFVYTHNYGCEPGTHLAFDEILRAADDVGMLVAFSQPHFAQYEWQAPDADVKNGYAQHAEYYVRAAQNHPSVVAYAMSHNATGYGEDMNPDLIDGLADPRSQRERDYVQRALRAEAIVKRLDDTRIVYHHSSGNLGSMHTMNFYPNFVPIQEMSDWFGHWATMGIKPVFTCEYGAPFGWDWAMYRGWYQGERSFGSAQVPWDFCLSEWNSQFLGDRAFQTSDAEKANLRWEAKQFRAGKVWHRWDYPFDLNSKRFQERYPVMAMYLTDNWRAFRTWGVSAISPWEHGHYWSLRDGVDRGRRNLKVDWQRLQWPGFSADYLDQRYERMDLAFERADWTPTPAAEALLRNNQPLLGYIAGKAAAFTSKDHNFFPGETVSKQLIVINNSREPTRCDCAWSIGLPERVSGSKSADVPAGEQARLPLEIKLPESLPPGTYDLRASFKFATGDPQDDTLTIHVVPRPAVRQSGLKIALFDPQGETGALLDQLGIGHQSVAATADLAEYDLLIVGKGALTQGGAAPDIARVRDGLRVLVFEQTGDVLEKRFGFRIAEYGLRQVFRRIPDHPLVAGLNDEHLRDWRGEATILPPQLKHTLRPRYGPTVEWCGIPVPRLWRCGNRGNVASVLIEKPPRGDFLPILDGGYSLQYSPLLEYREGRGLILFCQLDVTGRTEGDPAAETIVRRMFQYLSNWKPAPRRTVVYLGEAAGKDHLDAAGITTHPYERGKLGSDQLLVVGPGGAASLAGDAGAVAKWLQAGGKLLAIGLGEQDAAALHGAAATAPLNIKLRKAEHISAFFEPPASSSPLAGIGPADIHDRDPQELFLVSAGARVVGDGIVAQADDGSFVICQMAPWQFRGSSPQNLRKTYRRSSFLMARLLANLGATSTTQIMERFHTPVDSTKMEQRWLRGLYLDDPEEWDDPYRHFRW